MPPSFKTLSALLLISTLWLVLLGTTSLSFTVDPVTVRPAGAPGLVPVRTPVLEPPLSPATIRDLAREAYVWGWPLVYLHNCRIALERVPAPGRSGGMPVAPLNRLSMLTDRISPRVSRVPCPNQDVIYGFGMFDLEADAVVVQVPDFGGRFWLYQLGDQRTDSFAEVGSMYGTQPGRYLVVGPAWQGTVPAGIVGVFRCPTRYGYVLPRVFFTAAAGDREAALPAVNQIVAYPLAEDTGRFQTCDWLKSRWLPSLGGRGGKARGVTPESFFDTLSAVLDEVAPLPGEEQLYARFHRLLTAAAADPAVAEQLHEAAVATARDVVEPLFEFRNVGRPLPAHWTTFANGAAFGTDYHTRTAVAVSNVFVNRHHETKYYFQDLDAHGQRLDGSREYRITFPAGALPPARGFWSLTIYDERHRLPAGDGARISIGSRDAGLHHEADGSLTVVIGRDVTAAAGDALPNRLTAPDGVFSLYLRLYWPEETALDGRWIPPAVQPAASVLLQAGT